MKRLSRAIQTLGPQMTLEGKLVFEGTVQLDGHLSGTVESQEGTMIVGENAVIHADILVHTANVRGEIRGTIRAVERIELHPPARVYGDLCAPVVLIGAGVIFDGKCTTPAKDDATGKQTAVNQPLPEEKASATGIGEYIMKPILNSQAAKSIGRVLKDR